MVAGLPRVRLRDQIARELFRRARELAKRGGFDLEERSSGGKGYQGARKNRRNEDWITTGASGNAELAGGLKTMRERSRDMARNNRYGKQGLSQLASYMTGLRPMSAVEVAPDASEREKKRVAQINRDVDAVFREWSKVCHANGRLRFGGLQMQAALGMCTSGDSFTRLRVRRASDGLPVPLQLEVLEADLVDHTRNERLESGWIIQGVEFSQIGQVRGFHMHQTHPGESLLGLGFGAQDTVFVPVESVAHLYPEILSRPGQARGEPWFHAILQDLKDFDGYQDAERVRLRGSASLMGIVESQEEIQFTGEDPEFPTGINPIRDANGDIVERIRPGTIAYAMNGQKISFNSPQQTEGFAAYTDVDLHGMAAGTLTPYELFTGDLSKVNFSSIMFGMGSYWRMMGRFQQEIVIPLWGDPIWDRFVELGQLVRSLPPEAGPVKWVAEPWPLVDPMKQHKGTLIAVRGGWKTLEDAIAETGEDPDRVMATQVRLQQWARDFNVVLDALPSTTTLAGQVQELPDEEPGETDDEETEDEEDEDEDADVDVDVDADAE
jgi:lambda family phage portal protein